jgi:polyvinyl alcohol dehydrogenase (cytochrome)
MAWGQPTVVGGRVFVTSTTGQVYAGLGALDVATGKSLWWWAPAPSPVCAWGTSDCRGSLDAGGPVVADGVAYVNSGYGQFMGRGGNVLLALGVEGPVR